jgi:hypothetical protein
VTTEPTVGELADRLNVTIVRIEGLLRAHECAAPARRAIEPSPITPGPRGCIVWSKLDGEWGIWFEAYGGHQSVRLTNTSLATRLDIVDNHLPDLVYTALGARSGQRERLEKAIGTAVTIAEALEEDL